MLMVSSNSARISLRRGFDFCTIRAAKFFALQSEQVRALGLALLHLGGLYDVGIAACVVVKPTDEQTAAECLPAVARLADVEQDVGVGSEEGLNDTEDGVLQFLVVGRGTMTLVVDVKLVGTALLDGVIVHETNSEKQIIIGFNEVVATILRPNLIWGEAVDVCKVERIHRANCLRSSRILLNSSSDCFIHSCFLRMDSRKAAMISSRVRFLIATDTIIMRIKVL